MAKPYSVKPQRAPGRTYYRAVFRNSSGKRVGRGLGTDDLSKAEYVCAGLVRLWKERENPPIDEVDEDAVLLFFDQKKKPRIEARADDSDADACTEVDRFPREIQAMVLPVLIERAKLRRSASALKTQLAAAKAEAAESCRRLEALERTVIAQTAKATENLPPSGEALAEYRRHLFDTTGRMSAGNHYSVAQRFMDHLEDLEQAPPTLADVRPGQIEAWLEAEATKGTGKKPRARYRNMRIYLGKLFNWSASRWGYPTQMSAVRTVTKSQVLAERGDIRWHDLPEVERIIEGLPSTYWKALVATLAHAGLRLTELVWLRVQDVDLDKAQLWITSFEDPETGEVRKLKTGNSRRTLQIHGKSLLPRLRAYVEAGLAGKHYFFPMPEDKRPRTRNVVPTSERWRESTLSCVLRGHDGGKRRKPTEAILPQGTDARILRHTFGSLLLRNGKTIAEVAAAMGNTPEVASQHYAKILGREVQINY